MHATRERERKRDSLFMASSSPILSLVTPPLSDNKHEAEEPEASPIDYSKGVKNLVDTFSNLRSIPSNYVLPSITPPSLSLDHPSIPVIDLAGLDEMATHDQRISTVQAISSALAEWGFFRIVNHGVELSLMEEMMKTVDGFFSLPTEEKLKYASDNVMDPVRYGTSLNTSQPHILHWRDYLRHWGHPVKNSIDLWPNRPPNYRDVAKEYAEEVWKLAMRIMGAISEGLGLEKDYIEKSLGEGCQILACNYYPPCPQPDLTLGIAGHSDNNGLTILMQNDVDGLQVNYKDKWIPIPGVPGSFVCNLGDYSEILSNGKYKSVEHRAVVNEQRKRISIAAGHGPELTTIVQPAGPLLDENNPPIYRPIMYKDYMKTQQLSTKRGKHSLDVVKIHVSGSET